MRLQDTPLGVIRRTLNCSQFSGELKPAADYTHALTFFSLIACSRAVLVARGQSWGGEREREKKGEGQGSRCQPGANQAGSVNLHGGLIINETPGIWLLLYKLPVTSAFALLQETPRKLHPEAAGGKGEGESPGQGPSGVEGLVGLFLGPRKHLGNILGNMVNRIL